MAPMPSPTAGARRRTFEGLPFVRTAACSFHILRIVPKPNQRGAR